MPVLEETEIESIDVPDVPVSDPIAGDLDEPPVTPVVDTGTFVAQTTAVVNRAAAAADYATSFGSGGFAIGEGLNLSEAGSLVLTVSAGIATINGLVELATDTTVNIPPSTADVYVWLLQNGSLTTVTGSTTPPITNAVYLGKCDSDVSSITSIDVSGVLRWQGGIMHRVTSDIWAPQDAPSSSTSLFAKTAGGTFYWNGEEWLMLAPAYGPAWIKIDLDYEDINDAALTSVLDLVTLPAGMIFHAVKLAATTAFAGSGITDVDFEIGISGTDDKFLTSSDVTSIGQFFNHSPSMEDHDSDITIQLTATAVGANLSLLSNGVASVWIMYSVLP